jgi:hypothetical protein
MDAPVIVRVGMHFKTQGSVATSPLGDALRAVRLIEVEAPSVEAGEHYANMVMEALEREGDRQ